jgi:hypothetical protein
VLACIAVPTRRGIVPLKALVWHIRQQHFYHHVLAFQRSLAVGLHLHTSTYIATAAGRQAALSINFHHTGAAVAIGSVTFFETQMGNVYAMAFGSAKNAFPVKGCNLVAV